MQSPGTFSYTFGIKNESENPIEAVLDLSQSENMIFSSKGPMIKKTIKPNSIEYMMHA